MASVKPPRQGHGMFKPTKKSPNLYKTNTLANQAIRVTATIRSFKNNELTATPNSIIPAINISRPNRSPTNGSEFWRILAVPKQLTNFAAAVTMSNAADDQTKRLIKLRLFTQCGKELGLKPFV